MLDLTMNESVQCGGESLSRASTELCPLPLWGQLCCTLMSQPACATGVRRVMENVIVLQTEFKRSNNFNISYMKRVLSELYISSNYRHNPYTDVLYDSVWILALAVNSSLQMLKNINLTATTGNLDAVITHKIKESLFKLITTGITCNLKNGLYQCSEKINPLTVGLNST